MTFFKEFPRNFSRIISCNWFLGNSREIPQNWSPRLEIFVGSQFWDSVSRNSWEILRNFSPRNSSEFLQNYSLEIPEKFLELCHHVYGFFREIIKRISFEKFLGISLEFHTKKFLRNSPECFSGNSWEILKTWSPSLRIFRIFRFSPIGVSEVLFFYALLKLNLFFFASFLIKNDNLLQNHLLKNI